jgi:hypothetical protein
MRTQKVYLIEQELDGGLAYYGVVYLDFLQEMQQLQGLRRGK